MLKKVLLISLIVIPLPIKALSLECPQKASIGDEITCKITEAELIGLSAKIQLNEKLSYYQLDLNNTWSSYYYDKFGFSIGNIHTNNNLNASLKIKVNNNAEIGKSYEVSLIDIEGVTKEYQHQNIDNITKNINIVSNINTLDNIIISNGKIDLNFNKNTLKYDATTTEEEIDINALATDKGAKVEGDIGTKKLNIGANIFMIKVTSPKGSIKIYQLIITRLPKNTRTTVAEKIGIKVLKVNNETITIKQDIYSYSITVPESTNKVDIKAITTDNSASVSIENNNELSYGENIITINVTSKDGTKIKYLLTVTRTKKLDNNAKIKNLKIKNYFLDFNATRNDYQITIKDEKSLEIEVELDSKKAKYQINGNKNLKDKSMITIKVTAENGITNTYTIKINKAATNSNSVNIEKYLKLPTIILTIILSSTILMLNKKKRKNTF